MSGDLEINMSIKQFLIILLSVFALNAYAEVEQEQAIHEELRNMLDGIEDSINTENYSALAPYFHKKLRVTTVNQNTINTHDGIEPYFREWFGEGGYLQSLKISFKADAPTEFYNDYTMGIVRGGAIEQYKLTDGRDLDLDTRWTATVIKDTDSKWRILALHLGTNFYDNGIYHEMRRHLIKLGIVGTVAGAVVGLLLGLLLFKRKRSLTA